MSLTPDQLAEAKTMWGKGLTTGQIALALKVTRNVICGVAYRGKWPAHAPVAPKAKRVPAKRKWYGPPILSSPDKPNHPVPLTIPAAAVAVSLLDRSAFQCAWIIDEHPHGPDTLMCGAPITKGYYCAYHARIAWQPRQDSRRWDRKLGIAEASA